MERRKLSKNDSRLEGFKKVMAKHTDEELVRIVIFDRDNYQPLAVTVAEKELKKRNIDTEIVEQLTERLKEKIAAEIAEKKEDERPKNIWERLFDFVFFSPILGRIFFPIFLLIALLVVLFFGLFSIFGKYRRFQKLRHRLNRNILSRRPIFDGRRATT